MTKTYSVVFHHVWLADFIHEQNTLLFNSDCSIKTADARELMFG